MLGGVNITNIDIILRAWVGNAFRDSPHRAKELSLNKLLLSAIRFIIGKEAESFNRLTITLEIKQVFKIRRRLSGDIH